MSDIEEVTRSCSKCGARTRIKIYKYISIAKNPELKDKVRDGSLFLWECPHCGNVNLSIHEIMYLDPEKRLLIWLVPGDGIPETEKQASDEHLKWMNGHDYVMRFVTKIGDLVEKVLIVDAGLDDMVVEMCKYIAKLELVSKYEDKEQAAKLMDANFRFYSMDGDGENATMTIKYPIDGKLGGMTIGMNVYDDCRKIFERHPEMKPEGTFLCIDSSWIDSIMK